MNTELAHKMVCLFTPKLSLVLFVATYGRMAKLFDLNSCLYTVYHKKAPFLFLL